MRRAGHEQFRELLREIEARRGRRSAVHRPRPPVRHRLRGVQHRMVQAPRAAPGEERRRHDRGNRTRTRHGRGCPRAGPAQPNLPLHLSRRRAAVRARAVRALSVLRSGPSSGGSPLESSSPRSWRWRSRRTSASTAAAAPSRWSPRPSSRSRPRRAIADSAVVYLAQPVIVSAAWASPTSFLRRSAARSSASSPMRGTVPRLRQGLAYVQADLQLRVGRVGRVPPRPQRPAMLVLSSGSIGAFVAIEFVTGVPLVIALVLWSLWYSVRGFERSTEWDDDDAGGSRA